VPVDEICPERTAHQPSQGDPEHGRRHGDRGRTRNARLFEQGRESQSGRRTPGQGHRSGEDPEERLEPEGKGDQRAHDVLKDGGDRRNDEEHEDLGPADLEEPEAGGESDRREKGDHQRIAQGRIEPEESHIVPAGDEDGESDDQASDDRRGDVVSGQRPDPAAEAVPHEQHDPGEGDRMDEIQGDHAAGVLIRLFQMK